MGRKFSNYNVETFVHPRLGYRYDVGFRGVSAAEALEIGTALEDLAYLMGLAFSAPGGEKSAAAEPARVRIANCESQLAAIVASQIDDVWDQDDDGELSGSLFTREDLTWQELSERQRVETVASLGSVLLRPVATELALSVGETAVGKSAISRAARQQSAQSDRREDSEPRDITTTPSSTDS